MSDSCGTIWISLFWLIGLRRCTVTLNVFIHSSSFFFRNKTILLLLGEDYYGLSIHCYLSLVCLKAKAFMYRITGTTCCIQSIDNTISTKKT